MNWRQLLLCFLSGLFFGVQPLAAQNWAAQAPPYGRPDATIDLRTREGTQVIQGKWRYNDARIVEVDSKSPGPDLQSQGAFVGSQVDAPLAVPAACIERRGIYLGPLAIVEASGACKVS